MSFTLAESNIEVMDVSTAARSRRSIRAYKQEAIPRAEIEKILDAVRFAPSPMNIQPWRFVVVDNPEIKDQLAAVAFNQRQVYSAPAVIVLYTDMAEVVASVEEVVHPGMDAAGKARVITMIENAARGEAGDQTGVGSGFIALGYLLLAAESLGFQTSPMSGFDAEGVKKLLNIPQSARVPAIVAIGHGDEEGFPHHRHSVDRITRFV